MKNIFTSKKFFTPKKNFRKNAFTLAEVLITLGIIGVVAALTLPSLIGNYQEHATVTKLKKVYSVLENAYEKAVDENEHPANNWSTNPLPILSEYMILNKSCEAAGNCGANNTLIKTLSGSNFWKVTYQKQLSDGTSLIYFLDDSACNAYSSLSGIGRCGWILVDLNGSSKPNTMGRDVFFFALTNRGIYPFGTKNGIGFMSDESFSIGCAKDTATYIKGIACTAWVIYNENLDYLHCGGLSWDGKTKCN